MSGAMLPITVQIDDSAIQATLKRLQDRGQHLQPVFRDIGEYLIRSHRERFERQVDPGGHAWKKLSDRYLGEKPYNQDKILVLDGKLMGELHYAPPSETQLDFGTNAIYGATHQFGRGNIPERKFLGLSTQDKAEIMQTIQDYLTASF
jgi:phage virion morphogenesis protein